MPSTEIRAAGQRWLETLFRLVPVLIALVTLFIAVMQQINGLGTEVTVQTLLFGWLLLTPVATLLLWPTPDFVPELGLGLDTDSSASATDEDPVQHLRDRYARGDLSDAAFERKLDRLLETEDRSDVDSESAREPERTLERD